MRGRSRIRQASQILSPSAFQLVFSSRLLHRPARATITGFSTTGQYFQMFAGVTWLF